MIVGFLFELIFIIVIIRVVRSAYKKGGNQRPVNKSQAPYYTPEVRGVRSPVNTYQNQTQSRANTQRQTMQERPVQTAVKQDKPADEQSTMDYLNQKALEDKKEHAREKIEEKKRLDKKYGGLLPATRYLPGDRVPNGMRVVNCPYCRAENLVETIRTQRCCYFCRTKL